MNIFKGLGGSGHNKVAGKTSSDGIPHIGFGDKKKEDAFGVMVSESRKLFLNPDAKNMDGFIRTCFKTILDGQSGNGKNTHKACRELAKDMLATCQKIQDPNRKLEILKALDSLQTDTSMQSKQGDSLATICLFDPGSLDALRIQKTAAEADIVRAGPSRPNRTASSTNYSNNATLAQWSQSQVPVVSAGSSTINNLANQHPDEDMLDLEFVLPDSNITVVAENKEDVNVKIGPSTKKKLSASKVSYEMTDSERDLLARDNESDDYTAEPLPIDKLSLAEVQASLKDTNNGILKIIEAQSVVAALDSRDPQVKLLASNLKVQRATLKETSDLLKLRKKELETADISGPTGALNSTADNTTLSSAAPLPTKPNIYSHVIAAANKENGYEETKRSGNLDVNVASSNTLVQLAKDHESVSVKLQIASSHLNYLSARISDLGEAESPEFVALHSGKDDVLAEMKSLKIQKRDLEKSNPALKLKTYAVVVLPDFSADTYPNVQRSMADVGVFSMPSDNHTHENHDRAKVFMLGETRVTLVCDGVSDCGLSTAGTQITGEAAADSVSDGVKAGLAGDSEISDLIDNFSERVNVYKGDLSSPKAKETVRQNLNNIRSKITKKLNAISEKITPKASATTFEMSFEIAAEGKKFLVSFSVGDSQSLVYNKDTHAITQLNAKMYDASDANGGVNIYFATDLDPGKRPFKSTSDPLGTISGTHVLDAQSISVTLCELIPGDVVITASDGLTDAFAEMRGSTTKVDQTQLSEFMKDCGDVSNEDLAQRLAQESNSITNKPDDITVCVHTVMFDKPISDISRTIPYMTAGNVGVLAPSNNSVSSRLVDEPVPSTVALSDVDALIQKYSALVSADGDAATALLRTTRDICASMDESSTEAKQSYLNAFNKVCDDNFLRRDDYAKGLSSASQRVDIAKGLAQALIAANHVAERGVKINELIEKSKIKDFLTDGLATHGTGPDDYKFLEVGDFAGHDVNLLKPLEHKRFNDFKAALAALG